MPRCIRGIKPNDRASSALMLTPLVNLPGSISPIMSANLVPGLNRSVYRSSRGHQAIRMFSGSCWAGRPGVPRVRVCQVRHWGVLAFKSVCCAGMETPFPAAQAPIFGKTVSLDTRTLEKLALPSDGACMPCSAPNGATNSCDRQRYIYRCYTNRCAWSGMRATCRIRCSRDPQKRGFRETPPPLASANRIGPARAHSLYYTYTGYVP